MWKAFILISFKPFFDITMVYEHSWLDCRGLTQTWLKLPEAQSNAIQQPTILGPNRAFPVVFTQLCTGLKLLAFCKNRYQTIILTSRSRIKGNDAVKTLKIPSDNEVLVAELDLISSESINSFSKLIKEDYGGFDILVNNSGIASELENRNPVELEKVIRTNYFGTSSLMKKIFPLANVRYKFNYSTVCHRFLKFDTCLNFFRIFTKKSVQVQLKRFFFINFFCTKN